MLPTSVSTQHPDYMTSVELTPQERAIIEVSTGEMGNKPDAVKLGWLKMRTKEPWTKQQYTRALDAVMKKLRAELESAKKD